MEPVDFTTALGRLLRDGSLRDALATDPDAVAALLGLCGSDRDCLAALRLDDLERQSDALLRKRFAHIRELMPATCGRMGAGAWETFRSYARCHWPTGALIPREDARAFCLHLAARHASILVKCEETRLAFAAGGARFALRCGCIDIAGHTRPGLQLLIRPRRKGAWQEWSFHLRC